MGTSLDTLPVGSYAKILDIKISGKARRRVLDLGFIRGTKIEVVLKSPSGNTTAYQVRGTLIALRTKETSKIIVERLTNI
ncbi:MAG TPA: ferrous iron transport protein A [Thermoanaerobacterales bacterium]|nr:ferrous iron transport protein A [Thermoanaerobacterales bacterium]